MMRKESRMRKEQKVSAAAIATATLTLIVLACTCGPLAAVQGVQGTVGAAQGTLVSAATDFGAALPSLEAGLTEFAPTFEAQLTSVGPTIEAQLTNAGPGFDAALTQAAQAQLTGIAPTAQAGAGGEIRQWASHASATSEYGNPDWAAGQATGEPNTPQCGDYATAWATLSSTGVDALTLAYGAPVTPTRIEIHQSYNPGAITQVDVTTPGGSDRHIVYQAQATPVAECPFVLVIPISGLDVKVGEVVVYLDQTTHPGWNEIDAVELIGVP